MRNGKCQCNACGVITMDAYTSPFIFYGPCFCRVCKNNSIELFDYFNNPLGYKHVSDHYMNAQSGKVEIDFGKYSIYRMRCRKCGTNYFIKWNNGYPLPQSNYDGFMDNYTKGPCRIIGRGKKHYRSRRA